MSVYITDLAAFLPNQPVSNQQMEEILGMVNQLPSRTRRIILRNNKITTRYLLPSIRRRAKPPTPMCS